VKSKGFLMKKSQQPNGGIPMKTRSLTVLCGMIVAASVFATTASAAIITPLLSTDSGSITSSTTFQDAGRNIDAAINGAGLTGSLTEANILTVEHTSANAADGGTNHFLTSSTEAVADEVLTFDLGGTFDVTDIYIWIYSRPQTGRAIKNFDIAFDTGSGFGTPVAASTLGITDFPVGVTTPTTTAQQRTFNAAQTGVTAVQLTNIQNYGDARIGLPEIRFGGEETVIPEPASLAMGLMGLTLIAGRRRR
jgi:hypothetical protein